MATFNVTVDSLSIDREARRIGTQSKLVKTAVVEALNKTAYQARKAERSNIERTLDRAKTFTKQSVAVELSKREEVDPESRVFVLSRMEEILLRLEVGSVVSRKGIGISNAGSAFENRYGSIGKKGIRKLLRQERVFFAVINGTKGIWRREDNGQRPPPASQQPGVPAGMVRDPSTGRFVRRKNEAVSRRPRGSGARRRPLELLVAYLPRADYEPQLGFVAVGEEIGGKLLPNLQQQLRKRTLLR